MNQKITDAMKAVVEAPGYPFLESNKDDFYKHDLPTIENELEDGARYLWVLAKNSSHITRIGVHPKQDDWAKATISVGMQSTALGIDAYLVTTKEVKKLSERQAYDEINRQQYTCADGMVRNSSGLAIATIHLQKKTKPGDGNHYFTVQYNKTGWADITRKDALALRDIAINEGILTWGTLFVRAEQISLDGIPIEELIAIKPAYELNTDRPRG